MTLCPLAKVSDCVKRWCQRATANLTFIAEPGMKHKVSVHALTEATAFFRVTCENGSAGLEIINQSYSLNSTVAVHIIARHFFDRTHNTFLASMGRG